MQVEAYVAAEEARHVSGGRAVHAEQVAGHVMCRDQFARDRRMNAVVVVRREVDRRELAAVERTCVVQVGCEQFFERVIDALGLQQPVAPQRAGLAQRAVGRRHERIRVGIDGPRAVIQFPYEEVVEGRKIPGDPALHFVDPDVVKLQEAANQGILDRADADACQPVHGGRHPVFRQQVLGVGEESVQHERGTRLYSIAAVNSARTLKSSTSPE